MIDLSPQAVTIMMLVGLLVCVGLGYPLAFSLGGVALLVGYLTWGDTVFGLFYSKLFSTTKQYTLLAVPLFVLMGEMLGKSGIAEKLFDAFYIVFGGLRGSLAVATIMIGTIMAACVGIIGASVVMLSLVTLPAMMKRGYAKDLAAGAICAGGALGILIPPSIMLVIYGPTANMSVGKLFMGAFLPGLLLSALYIVYIVVRCFWRVQDGPPMPVTERGGIPVSRRLSMLVRSLLPPATLILAVLGSIFLGVAAPTEAAAIGASASVVLALAYRVLDRKVMRDAVMSTLVTTGMVFMVIIGAGMFTSIFLGSGGGDVVSAVILAAPLGKWGSFVLIMLIIFILGMFIDWVGIVLIMVPLVTPIGETLGFDPVWFAMMIIVNLQMSFLSPPFAYSIFFLRGQAPAEYGLTTPVIIKGVVPFIACIAAGLVLLVLFPEIIVWLPSVMITAG
ncbi:MAG: TRAP transporter large permease [Candidatus Thorarchaeota archaeon]